MTYLNETPGKDNMSLVIGKRLRSFVDRVEYVWVVGFYPNETLVTNIGRNYYVTFAEAFEFASMIKRRAPEAFNILTEIDDLIQCSVCGEFVDRDNYSLMVDDGTYRHMRWSKEGIGDLCGPNTNYMGGKFEIQTYTLCDGWVNTWTDGDEEPATFNSKLEAETALNDYLDDINDAVKSGDMIDGYNKAGFRIVPLGYGNK